MTQFEARAAIYRNIRTEAESKATDALRRRGRLGPQEEKVFGLDDLPTLLPSIANGIVEKFGIISKELLAEVIVNVFAEGETISKQLRKAAEDNAKKVTGSIESVIRGKGAEIVFDKIDVLRKSSELIPVDTGKGIKELTPKEFYYDKTALNETQAKKVFEEYELDRRERIAAAVAERESVREASAPHAETEPLHPIQLSIVGFQHDKTDSVQAAEEQAEVFRQDGLTVHVAADISLDLLAQHLSEITNLATRQRNIELTLLNGPVAPGDYSRLFNQYAEILRGLARENRAINQGIVDGIVQEVKRQEKLQKQGKKKQTAADVIVIPVFGPFFNGVGRELYKRARQGTDIPVPETEPIVREHSAYNQILEELIASDSPSVMARYAELAESMRDQFPRANAQELTEEAILHQTAYVLFEQVMRRAYSLLDVRDALEQDQIDTIDTAFRLITNRIPLRMIPEIFMSRNLLADEMLEISSIRNSFVAERTRLIREATEAMPFKDRQRGKKPPEMRALNQRIAVIDKVGKNTLVTGYSVAERIERIVETYFLVHDAPQEAEYLDNGKDAPVAFARAVRDYGQIQQLASQAQRPQISTYITNPRFAEDYLRLLQDYEDLQRMARRPEPKMEDYIGGTEARAYKENYHLFYLKETIDQIKQARTNRR